jgi:chromosome segregation ATPase
LQKAEKCDQIDEKLNNAIQQLSQQRENHQRDLGGLNERNVELAKKLDALIAERQVCFLRYLL